MKFFEFEEEKIYISNSDGGEYRKRGNVLQYYSVLHGSWLPSALTPYELYRIDFNLKLNANEAKFEYLHRNDVDYLGTYGNLTVGLNPGNLDDLASGNVPELYLEIDGADETLTLTEFDTIVEFVNEIKALAKEVRK